MALSFAEVEEVVSTLEGAGREDLAAKCREVLRDERWGEELSVSQAATILGVKSPNTVKSWLEGGHFPGAFKTKGGHWRFPKSEVLAVKAALADLSQKNREGDLTPLDLGDAAPEPPLL